MRSMSDQFRDVRVEINVAKATTRVIGWPVLGVAFALICVVAWDIALLWLVAQLCRTVFF